MSQNYFDPDWRAKISLPVTRVGKHWEFFYGGDVPVREGSLGELRLDARDISDQSFLRKVTQTINVRILTEGASLLVALNDRSQNGARIGSWPDISPEYISPGTTRFEKVRIGPLPKKLKPLSESDSQGGLWLRLKGLERIEIRSSVILMPADFPTTTATSLNHAFTLLSREYETHRISNTGNVYKQFFYQEKNGKWYPLGDLRDGVLVQGERALMSSAWEEIERMLGWRPVKRPPIIR